MLKINVLEDALAARFWSKADLVKAAGLSKVTVDRIFKDDADVRLSTIKAVLDALGLSFGAVLDEETAPKAVVHTEGDYSPASKNGDVSVIVGDAVLVERVKSLEALLAEKNARIEELKERIEELKSK